MRSVVVTGAGGFVGRHVTTALAAAGMSVIGTARRDSTGDLAVLDVEDKAAVRLFLRAIPPPDAVVHLAAIAHPRRDRVPAAEFDRVNHQGLRHVLDEARAAGVGRVVFFSSSVVYGDDPGRCVAEDAPRRPVGPYARSKRDAEDVCFEAMHVGAPVVVLRFPVIYGATCLSDLRSRAFVPFTGNRILLRIVGRQPEFSLCSVENAVDAVRYALDAPLAAGVYNVADAEPYSQAEVRDIIASIDGTRAAVSVPEILISAPIRLVSGIVPTRIGEALRANHAKLFVGSTLDTTRIQRAGFVPRHRLDELATQAPRAAHAGAAC